MSGVEVQCGGEDRGESGGNLGGIILVTVRNEGIPRRTPVYFCRVEGAGLTFVTTNMQMWLLRNLLRDLFLRIL